MQIVAIHHECKEVGKIVANSKLKYIWVIEVNGRVHNILLTVSKVSDKTELKVDNLCIFSATNFSDRTYDFEIEPGVSGKLNKLHDYYLWDLLVNNVNFKRLGTRGSQAYLSGMPQSNPIQYNSPQTNEQRAKPYVFTTMNTDLAYQTQEKAKPYVFAPINQQTNIQSFNGFQTPQNVNHHALMSTGFSLPQNNINRIETKPNSQYPMEMPSVIYPVESLPTISAVAKMWTTPIG